MSVPSVVAAVRRIQPAREPHDDQVLGIVPIRTDVPLVPVPFAERMHSPLWDSLTPKPRCLKCNYVKPLSEFTQSEKELKRNPMLRYKAYRKCDACREGSR